MRYLPGLHALYKHGSVHKNRAFYILTPYNLFSQHFHNSHHPQMSFQHSSSTGLTISIGNVEVDIFVAQRTVARLLRGLQKTQLLRKSRCFGHWKSWDQYEQ